MASISYASNPLSSRMLAVLLTMLSNEQVSNTFHFTFTVCSNMLKNGLTIRNVVPSTEEEARRILERMEAEGLCN
jgi:acyl-coenzyme A thioesterase 9